MQNVERIAVSSLTSKGQVTMPAEIRRRLGVKPKDKVAWVIEDGEVKVAPTRSVVERTAGALAGGGPALTAEEERAAAEAAIAQEAVDRMGG
jgi:AbrB family looped-hinge helix DNA binding protein